MLSIENAFLWQTLQLTSQLQWKSFITLTEGANPTTGAMSKAKENGIIAPQEPIFKNFLPKYFTKLISGENFGPNLGPLYTRLEPSEYLRP